MSTEIDHVFLPIGSSEIITHSMAPRLASGELLTGTPTITDITDAGSATGELTFNSPQVNTVADTPNDIAIGEAVQFRIETTSTEAAVYLIKMVVSKDTGDSQVVSDYLWVHYEYPCS